MIKRWFQAFCRWLYHTSMVQCLVESELQKPIEYEGGEQ